MTPARRLSLALVALVACAPYRPPFTQVAGASAPAAAHQASLVFLWPATSCDPAGYFTLATADGHFIGNISRGSRLSTFVPAGESTVVAWNDLVEGSSGWMRKGSVPALHAHLVEGRTYYVRMVFGDWDERGPTERRLYTRRFATPLCVAATDSATSAMVVLSPASAEWAELSEWLAQLDPIAPDRAAGQAWLDRNRASLMSHAVVGLERFAGMRPQGKRLATIEPEDGAP